MYIISNRDMEQVIEYIETMTQCLSDTGLRACNKKRMAMLLLKKLRAKKPLSTNSLSDYLPKK